MGRPTASYVSLPAAYATDARLRLALERGEDYYRDCVMRSEFRQQAGLLPGPLSAGFLSCHGCREALLPTADAAHRYAGHSILGRDHRDCGAWPQRAEQPGSQCRAKRLLADRFARRFYRVRCISAFTGRCRQNPTISCVFFAGDELGAEISGDSNEWRRSDHYTMGLRSFRWCYHKDFAGDRETAAGEDRAWIDRLLLRPLAVRRVPATEREWCCTRASERGWRFSLQLPPVPATGAELQFELSGSGASREGFQPDSRSCRSPAVGSRRPYGTSGRGQAHRSAAIATRGRHRAQCPVASAVGLAATEFSWA